MGVGLGGRRAPDAPICTTTSGSHFPTAGGTTPVPSKGDDNMLVANPSDVPDATRGGDPSMGVTLSNGSRIHGIRDLLSCTSAPVRAVRHEWRVDR